MAGTTTHKRIDDLAKGIDHRFDRVEGDVREIRSELRELSSEVKAGNVALRVEIKDVDKGLRAEIKGHGQRLASGDQGCR